MMDESFAATIGESERKTQRNGKTLHSVAAKLKSGAFGNGIQVPRWSFRHLDSVAP
jgi:hypothetical protein